jgi:cell division protein ZipA
MDPLRIILLVAGLLFVAALVGYEWWRSRGARPAALPPRDFDETPRNYSSGSITRDDGDTGHEAKDFRDDDVATRSSQPLPEINVARDARVAVGDMLPVIDISSAPRDEESVPRRDAGICVSDEVAVDRPSEATSTQAILRAHDEPFVGEKIGEFDEVSAPRVLIPEAGEADSRGPQIVVQWPNDAERRIVTLRVLPQAEPRFGGRALRQAFASAGFWHGPLDIFHLPDAKGRAIVSAAALAQPGTFDPSIMDSQRFSGVNLFSVLPGPMAERETFEELVHAARQIAERLGGRITDQHGDELTQARIARLRQSLEAAPTARAAGES